MSTANNLNTLFNVEPTPPVQFNYPVVVKPDAPDTSQADIDHDTARESLKNIIKVGNEGIVDLKRMADSLESADGYEALAKMILAVTKSSKELVELHKLRKEIAGTAASAPAPAGTTKNYIDKAVFVGSPDDLMEQMNKNDK